MKKNCIVCGNEFWQSDDKQICCSPKCSGINNRIKAHMRKSGIESYERAKKHVIDWIKEKETSICFECGKPLVNQKKGINRCSSCIDNLKKKLDAKYEIRVHRKDLCIYCGKKLKKGVTGKGSLLCEECQNQKKRKLYMIKKSEKGAKEVVLDDKSFREYVKKLLNGSHP